MSIPGSRICVFSSPSICLNNSTSKYVISGSSPMISFAASVTFDLSSAGILLSSVLATSTQILASAPLSIFCFSSSVKMAVASKISDSLLSSVASEIGASGSTSASLSSFPAFGFSGSSGVPVAGISLYFLFPQPALVHVVSIFPVSVSVASFTVFHSSDQLCPSAFTTSCATSTLSHTEQCFPSVFPAVVQVGATAVSTSGV